MHPFSPVYPDPDRACPHTFFGLDEGLEIMITPIVRALVESGATPEMILAAVMAYEDYHIIQAQEKRTYERERKREQRLSQKSPIVPGTNRDTPLSPPDRFPHLPLTPPITPPEKPNLTIREKDLPPVADAPALTPVILPKPAKQTRKTRMTPEFIPPAAWRDYAMEYGYSEQEAAGIASVFRDYWLAKGEPMADWFATWRNWIRRNEKFEAKRAGA